MNNNIDFNEIKQKVIPYFTKVYGEQYKDIITERLNNTYPVFYTTLDTNNIIKYEMVRDKTIELTFKFLKYNNIDITKEEYEDIMNEKHFRYYLNDNPKVKSLLDFCFDSNEYKEYNNLNNHSIDIIENNYQLDSNIRLLNKLGYNINSDNYLEWLKSDEGIEVKNFFEHQKNILKELDKEYKEFYSIFEKFDIKKGEYNILNSQLKIENTLLFLEEIKEFMTNEDINMINEYRNNGELDWKDLKYNLDILNFVGKDIDDNEILIESFSTKADEILNDEEASIHMKNRINDNRIEYYKKLDVYDSSMTDEDFLNSDIAKKYAYNNEKADKIINIKDKYINKYKLEFAKESSSFKNNMNSLNEVPFVNEPSYLLEVIAEESTSIIPNAIIDKDGIKLAPILIYSVGKALEDLKDVLLIHELNHIVELSLDQNVKDGQIYKCGFEKISLIDDEFRDYEAFSEIINHMIAMEITNVMHEDNVTVFDNIKTAKIKGATSYEKNLIIVNEFYSIFKDDIIKSRVDNNMKHLYEVVGADNFKKLNQTLIQYNELNPYKLIDDILANKKTPLVIEAERLENESKELLLDMVNYASMLPEYSHLKDVEKQI